MDQALSLERVAEGIGNWTQRPGPRYLRLADALHELVHQEAPASGARLPSERDLARRLGLSRGTVVSAYAELAERGLVKRRQGSGTRVVEGGRRERPPIHRNPQLSRFVTGPDVAIDLSFGGPYLDELMAGVHARALDALSAGAPPHGYVPLGLPALREAVAARAERAGVRAAPENVLMTAGGQGALALLTAAMVRPGDRVIIEAPSYPGAIELFSRAGATIVALPRDHAGCRPEDLRRALAGTGAAFVFLIPTCHNPTGSIMHDWRRRELLSICREHATPVIEDDTMADMVFDGEAPPPMSAHDPEHVISVGSFSKVLWGGLRVGWIRAPRALILRLGRLKAAQDLGGGVLDQLAALGAVPELDAMVTARRRQAAERYAVLTAALRERLPEWEFAPCRGGYSLWVRLPAGTGDELAAAAMTSGVAIASGSASAPHDLFLDHVRICFAAPPEVLIEAVDRLAAVWGRVMV